MGPTGEELALSGDLGGRSGRESVSDVDASGREVVRREAAGSMGTSCSCRVTGGPRLFPLVVLMVSARDRPRVRGRLVREETLWAEIELARESERTRAG